MSDDKLKDIVNELSSEMAEKHFDADKLHERNKHLVDENGKINFNDQLVMIISESTSYTHNFTYSLLKRLEKEGFLANPDK